MNLVYRNKIKAERLQKFFAAFLCLIILGQSLCVFAFETDQYNLPPEPLGDIGGEVSDYAWENIAKAIRKINFEIAERLECLEKKSKSANCQSEKKEKARLAELRSETAVAREVFKLLGGGIPPFTNSEIWLEKHNFKTQPARYKTSYQKSIFRLSPVNYLTISETVKMFGAEFGTDKIAHIFQQGYTYYKIYERAKKKGAASEKAARKAVQWGQMTERTFYGILVSGVFSNGDLAANFIGMKFYQNLANEIKIGSRIKPPILILKDGFWEINEPVNERENILKPFITDHLNEALNPSIFIILLGFRSGIRQTVKNQSCRQWREKYPKLKQADFENLTENLKSWHGEDYGFKESGSFITIGGECFAQD